MSLLYFYNYRWSNFRDLLLSAVSIRFFLPLVPRVKCQMNASSFLHSPSKCLAWVKKCRHVWLDQNFDPFLLTKKLIFMRKKQKKKFFSKKKIQNGRLKKSSFFKIANSQNFDVFPGYQKIPRYA